jgi:hypothetical protein
MDPTPYHTKSKRELELSPDPRQIGWAISIVWKNCGLSPALDVRGFGHSQKRGLDDATPLTRPPIDPMKLQTPGGVIAPQGTLTTTCVRLTYDECNRIALDELDVLIFGRMEYRDGFDRTPLRHTDVCLKVNVGDNPRTSKNPFRFAAHYEHNYAD